LVLLVYGLSAWYSWFMDSLLGTLGLWTLCLVLLVYGLSAWYSWFMDSLLGTLGLWTLCLVLLVYGLSSSREAINQEYQAESP
jgi:hypothetical protein